MFEKHVIRDLSAYHHGELTAEEKTRVETHLRMCSKCRTGDEEIRFGMQLASSLSATNAPETTERVLLPPGQGGAKRRMRAPSPAASRHPLPVGEGLGVVLAVVMIALLILVFFRGRTTEGPSWEVTGVPGMSRLRPGDALQTNSSSQAEIKIANVGQLKVEANTRVRLLVTQPNQHKIALDRGKVEATTWAPPRLFIVETPSANAIDLGCKYTLEVEEDGGSLLHVTLGLVALDRGGHETIVPAGAFCRTHSGAGPGTPFFEDSSAQFQAALYTVDSLPEGPERTRQLAILIHESHVRDALSLWHLMPRLDPQSRALIYDRLAQLLPPPQGVTRDGIVALDSKMLDAWRQIISQLWQ